ncbi:MAG TPA: DUF2232 domain-containing protein [Limnochordia bacterium]|nr:DUF2232 domain-containing protein [Limnochordia bacterium]
MNGSLRAAEFAAYLGLAVGLPLMAMAFPPAALFIGMPLAVLTYRRGFRFAALMAIGIGVVVGLLTQPWAGFMYALNLAIGIGIGWAFVAQWPAARTAAFAMALGVAAFVLAWVILKGVVGFDPAAALDHFMGTGPQGRELAEREQQVLEWVRKVQPALGLLGGAAAGFFSTISARALLIRQGADLPALPPFRSWRAPWPLAWGYILGLGLEMAPKAWFGGSAHVIGYNLDVVFSVLFALIGLAILWYLFDELKWGWPRILAAALLLQLGPVLVWAGLLDSWFDFRTLWERRVKEN